MTSPTDLSNDLYINAALGKKAIEPVALDVTGLTSVADVFIIMSGSSNRQVTALADHIKSELKKHGISPLNIEGKKEGHWVLMDYGHVVYHIFYKPVREFYNLEGLWVDAVRIDMPGVKSV